MLHLLALLGHRLPSEDQGHRGPSLAIMSPSMTFKMPSMMVQPYQSTTNHVWPSQISIRLKSKSYLDTVDEVVEAEEDIGNREKTKGEVKERRKAGGATPRLKQIAADLVVHFEDPYQSYGRQRHDL